MNKEDWEKMNWTQRETMLIAMHVRNEMEDFHVEHLSDAQMKELNLIIRNAIYEVLVAWRKFSFGSKKTFWSKFLEGLFWNIPDYWEIPRHEKKLENYLKKCYVRD